MVQTGFLLFLIGTLTIFSVTSTVQFAFADFIDDIFKSTEKILDEITDSEKLIRQAIENGNEKLALEIALSFGKNFSEIYFETYSDINSQNLTFEHILLTVILHYDVQEYSKILSLNPFLRQFEINKINSESEKIKEDIRKEHEFLGTYDIEAWKILENNSKRILIAKYSDQSNVDELYKTRSLDEEATIMILEMTPSYDPKTGQLVTLNQTITNTVKNIPALDGTDIEKEPIRAGVLLATEPDYTMQAKLIKTSDGHVISLEEAIMYDYKNEDVKKAQLALELLDAAMDAKKIDHPQKKAQEFRDLIEKINNESNYLLP